MFFSFTPNDYYVTYLKYWTELFIDLQLLERVRGGLRGRIETTEVGEGEMSKLMQMTKLRKVCDVESDLIRHHSEPLPSLVLPNFCHQGFTHIFPALYI